VSATATRGDGKPPILTVSDMHTYYGSIAAVKGISIEVFEGEIVSLIGSNGAGKSTTMRSISGIVPPRRGTITFQGETISGMPGHKVTAAGICQSPEGRRIFGRMSVLENLELGAFLRNDRAGIDEDLEHVLELFPRLKERLTQKAGTMSGGEQQMLAMSRAIATNPALLLLDELSMGLAPIIVEELYERVAEMAAMGVSILVVEQFAQAVLGVADIASIMLHGRITRTGPPAEIAEELADAYLGATAETTTV
jgi:branched-chain amino acid transport system ATP-binding protein